jgi:hypothetical protein
MSNKTSIKSLFQWRARQVRADLGQSSSTEMGCSFGFFEEQYCEHPLQVPVVSAYHLVKSTEGSSNP